MTPENQPGREPGVGQPARLTPTPGTAHSTKGRAKNKNLTPIKLLITAASVAGTMGGWGLLAHHDAVLAEQADRATLVALVTEQAAPTATLLPALTATPVATATNEATATAEPTTTTEAAPVDATTAEPTATTEPTATVEATATAEPTATMRTVITTTKSSR